VYSRMKGTDSKPTITMSKDKEWNGCASEIIKNHLVYQII
jgi:hypothetical protein